MFRNISQFYHTNLFDIIRRNSHINISVILVISDSERPTQTIYRKADLTIMPNEKSNNSHWDTLLYSTVKFFTQMIRLLTNGSLFTLNSVKNFIDMNAINFSTLHSGVIYNFLPLVIHKNLHFMFHQDCIKILTIILIIIMLEHSKCNLKS